MRKVTKVLVVLALMLLSSCGLFERTDLIPAEPSTTERDAVRKYELEIDGVQYYWVYQKNYPGHGQIVCPARDKALIER